MMKGRVARDGSCDATTDRAASRRLMQSPAHSSIEAQHAPHIVHSRQIGQEGDEIGELGVMRVIEP